MKLSTKTRLAIKSWWHAAISVEGAFVAQYVYTNVILAHTSKWDWASFLWSAGAAVLAPTTRALALRYPKVGKFLPKVGFWLKAKFSKKTAIVTNQVIHVDGSSASKVADAVTAALSGKNAAPTV